MGQYVMQNWTRAMISHSLYPCHKAVTFSCHLEIVKFKNWKLYPYICLKSIILGTFNKSHDPNLGHPSPSPLVTKIVFWPTTSPPERLHNLWMTIFPLRIAKKTKKAHLETKFLKICQSEPWPYCTQFYWYLKNILLFKPRKNYQTENIMLLLIWQKQAHLSLGLA